jgi:parvulin-like peptidyl-prolyl isomerase
MSRSNGAPLSGLIKKTKRLSLVSVMPLTTVNTHEGMAIFKGPCFTRHARRLSVKIIVPIMILTAISLLTTACGDDPAPGQEARQPAEDTSPATPDIATGVQEVTSVGASHVLISYAGSQVQGVERSREEALDLINGLHQRISDADITFAQAASEFSDCPSGRDGGALGVFNRGAMVPEFDQAVFALEIGELSGIVETQFGYHLILRTQ